MFRHRGTGRFWHSWIIGSEFDSRCATGIGVYNAGRHSKLTYRRPGRDHGTGVLAIIPATR